MPKFSEHEKELILDKLRLEGEALFIQHGIKKVTIEDLTASVGISKGSFYAFFESKEHLFMDLNIQAQRTIFALLKDNIVQGRELSPKELTCQTLRRAISLFWEHPIINLLDTKTWEMISRKIPSFLLEQHQREDAAFVKLLKNQGVHFLQPVDLVTKMFQAVLSFSFDIKEEPQSEQILDIMIEGIVDKLVAS